MEIGDVDVKSGGAAPAETRTTSHFYPELYLCAIVYQCCFFVLCFVLPHHHHHKEVDEGRTKENPTDGIE